MNLIFVTEARFFKNTKGDIYGDAAFEKTIWQRYMNIFDQIFIVARVEQNFDNFDNKYISSGEKISFIEKPNIADYFESDGEARNFAASLVKM